MELKYKWIPCKKGYYTPYKKGVRNIEGIIIHQTDGYEAGDVATLSGQTKRKVSAHWYVAKTGKIYHFVDNNDIAWHAGECIRGWGNSNTIGIENEHIGNKRDWTDAQMDALAKLIVALRQKYGKNIICKGHSDVAVPRGRKVDPEGFDWNDLHNRAEKFKSENILLVKEDS